MVRFYSSDKDCLSNAFPLGTKNGSLVIIVNYQLDLPVELATSVAHELNTLGLFIMSLCVVPRGVGYRGGKGNVTKRLTCV